MDALAHFIVRNRKKLFIGFVVFALACGCIMPLVTVNKDMSKYIPDGMQSKIGMNLMADEFAESSLVRAIVVDATTDEGATLADDVANFDSVKNVVFDAADPAYSSVTPDGLDAILLEIEIEGGTYSQQARDSIDNLEAEFENLGRTVYLDSAVIDAGMPSLGFIILIAMAILIAILFLMCSSWFEPILLFFAIGLAVLMNMGTNLILGDVSEVTFSIAAVFQLVLSMDYSIMLMNRYRLERQTANNLEEAMAAAIRNSCSAIFSSSGTTIVGLVCLVFMSFTIGRDMGLVLAKGVAFSLLCVVFVMPALILRADRILEKTTKRAFRPAFRRYARLCDKLRVPILILFVVLFAIGLSARNLCEATYKFPSLNENREYIDATFPAGSQVVVLYDNDDEAAIAALIDDIDSQAGVKSVSGYANTVGKAYSASEMADFMGADESFIKLAYAMKSAAAGSSESTLTMTLHAFAQLAQDMLGSDGLVQTSSVKFDPAMLVVLENLTSPDYVNQQRTASSMASLLSGLSVLGDTSFELTADEVSQIYLARAIEKGSPATKSMTLPAFVKLVQSVAKDELFAGRFSDETMAQIDELAKLTNVSRVTTPLTSSAMANALGMSTSETSAVYLLYQISHFGQGVGSATTLKLTIQQFLAYLVDDVSQSSIASVSFDDETMAQLKQARMIVDASVAGRSYSPSELSSFFNGMISTEEITQLFVYDNYQKNGQTRWAMSLYDFVSYLIGSSQTTLAGMIDADSLAQLTLLKQVMDSGLASTSYTPAGMSSLFASFGTNVSSSTLETVYLYSTVQSSSVGNQTMTLPDFVDYVIGDIAHDSRFSSYIDSEMLAELKAAKNTLSDAESQFVGLMHNRLIINTTVAEGAEEMISLIDYLNSELTASDVDYYLVGEGPMSVDMSSSFFRELNFITILTAAAIFLIVLLTFKSLIVPIVLVALIQGAFFLVMGINGLVGHSMYYVAILIVQAIMMGATIDYAILFATNYRESRKHLNRTESMLEAYRNSIATILTSGFILVFVTGLLGVMMQGAVAQICLTLAEGATSAIVLVIFILPGILAALDRFVCKRNERFGN